MVGQEVRNDVNHREVFERGLIGEVPECRRHSDNPSVLQKDSDLGGYLICQRQVHSRLRVMPNHLF
jgi:hypothetical protein